MRKTGKKFPKLSVAMYFIATVIRVSALSADGNCPVYRADNFEAVKKMALRGHTIKEFGNKSRMRCAKLCADNDKCRSFNHDKTNGICQLKDARHVEFPGDLHHDESFNYYVVDQKPPSDTICWPSGTYGLPMPKAGCPSDDGFNWRWGLCIHRVYGSDGYMWSAGMHLRWYWRHNMEQEFCMKTVDRVEHCEAEWPEGEYCVFKYGDHCPANMKSGSIYWNADLYHHFGEVPSGQYLYTGDIRIDYCCMISGCASQPIALPTAKPFYLFPYTSECQQVQGMKVTREWFMWDCVGNQTAPVGSHPLYQPSGNDHYIYYCYYEPK